MNPMVAQIHSIPELIRSVVSSYDQAVRTALTEERCHSVRRIYLTGCGDSHHASLGAELAFELLGGIPTEAQTSLQFARYAVNSLDQPENTWVFGTSVSGEVSRTVEGLLMARKAGAVTIAMTATPKSRVGRAADIIVDTTQPPFDNPEGMVIPGVRSYVANQIGLLLVALRLGEVRGHITPQHADLMREEIADLAVAAEQTIKTNDPLARMVVQSWQDAAEFVFLGSGPNLASAYFSAAKVLEASGDPAWGQDLEEWAHLQYFAKAADTPTILITAGQRDLSRAREVATAAQTIGRRLAIVGPANNGLLHKQAEWFFPLSGSVREMFSPVISAIPASLLAAYRAELLNEPFFRDFSGGRSKEGGGGISRIRTSETLGLEFLDEE